MWVNPTCSHTTSSAAVHDTNCSYRGAAAVVRLQQSAKQQQAPSGTTSTLPHSLWPMGPIAVLRHDSSAPRGELLDGRTAGLLLPNAWP
jgi:hypothetical protein